MNFQTRRILLLGTSGWGARHLENIARLGQRVQLVGTVEPRGALISGVPNFTSGAEAFKTLGHVDVAIVATPPHTHAALAREAVDHGAHVLLEKPPTTTSHDWLALRDSSDAAGALVQVGFQSIGSRAIAVMQKMIEGGDVEWIGGAGAWSQDVAYWNRAAWTGTSRMGDHFTTDGVFTNAFAHMVQAALSITGATSAMDIEALRAGRFRANDIECDDTSWVEVGLHQGPQIRLAATLAADQDLSPHLILHGPREPVKFHYIENSITVNGARTFYESRDLLENLLDTIDGRDRLLVPLADTEAYQTVHEYLRTKVDTELLPSRLVAVAADQIRVPGLSDWAEKIATWRDSELDPQRALRSPASNTGTPLKAVPATRVEGGALALEQSPRPYLHPVRTLGGTILTAERPAGHPHHAGLGEAFPYANEVSFWGDDSFRADETQRPHRRHGRILTRSISHTDSTMAEELEWVSHDGTVLIEQQRQWAFAVHADSWTAELSSVIAVAGKDVLLESPGSRGRAGWGYGGLFWRFPDIDQARVHTRDAEGEAQVHGSRSPWIRLSGLFAGAPATVTLEAVGHSDPWFVHISAYPGIGSAPTWDAPYRVQPGRPLSRAFRITVADGILQAPALPRTSY